MNTAVVVLTQAEREALCKSVQVSGGWPAGFGVWGTKLSLHDQQASGDIKLAQEDMGDAFEVLLSILDTHQPKLFVAPAAAELSAHEPTEETKPAA